MEMGFPLELSKYIRDLLQEGLVEKVLAKLKKALFDSFELLKELRDKVKVGQIAGEDFQAQKVKIEKRIDSLSNRILYIKKAKERAPIIEERIQKEAELLMNEFQVERIVMMMINAIGMVERREQELQKRVEAVEEAVDLIKSFILSKPAPQPRATASTMTAPSAPPTIHATRSTSVRPIPSPSPLSSPRTGPPSSSAPLTAPTSPDRGPSEDDIAAFRKKLLKPAPKEAKEAKPKPKPVSIRSALLQEMKEFFGSATDALEKEKEAPDEPLLAKDAVEEEKEESDDAPLAKATSEKEEVEPDEPLLAKEPLEKEESDEQPLAKATSEKAEVELDEKQLEKDAIKEEKEEPEILLVVDDSDT